MTLTRPTRPYCLFEDNRASADKNEGGETSAGLLFENPVCEVVAHTLGDVPSSFDEIERATAAGRSAAGYVRYEAACAIADPALPTYPPEPDAPLLRFFIFEAPQPQPLDFAGLDNFWRQRALQAPSIKTPSVNALMQEGDYSRAIAAIKAYLQAGDIYQANFTFPMDIKAEGSAEALYAQLRRSQPAAFSAFLAFDNEALISQSPERFFSISGDTITAQPMKGTLPTHASGGARALKDDPKNRAENLMIVDLLRNDLSRISKPGSVRVPSLFEVEALPTVFQMTSTVEGTLKAGVGLKDVFSALFPCGSVTGAPKRRAMEIIKSLELGPRGVYCGAIGYVLPGGTCSFSVPIRTLHTDHRRTRAHVGSGIVADSVAESEYAECLVKARYITQDLPPYSLLETMGWSPDHEPTKGRAVHPLLPDYWALHFRRMRQSAAALGFAAPDQSELETALKALLALQRTGRRLKVRLVYGKGGTFSLSAQPLVTLAGPLKVALGMLDKVTIDPRFLCHKTTFRDHYKSALAAARKANQACDEVFLLEPNNQLTEGTFTNIFIEREGKLYTPQATGRFLPGTLRTHLIASGQAHEAVLTQADLATADAVYAGNALRGLLPVQMLPAAPDIACST